MRVGAPATSRPAGGPIQQHKTAAISRSLSLGSGRPVPPGHFSRRRWAARTAAGPKDAPASIISYTVQKGESLWDVAVQHGVSMRTIKDLNKLPGSDPVLTEGQQLLVPASGITAVSSGDTAVTAAALGTSPARGLWVGSEHVRLATIAEAKQLYLRQCDRGNSQNTLLVLYAPWCPHCRDMEDELERLAEGLSSVSAVRVVAVNGDSMEGRIFAREVLGVAYYPSIISFPEHSRTFYKYKGRQRDAESLLRFLNMTCCARDDQMWTLRPTATNAALARPGAKETLLQWVNHWTPVGTSPGAFAAGTAILLAAAGAGVWLYSRRQRPSVGDEVVAELDSSLGRMAQLMMRAVWTRMALLMGIGGPAEAAASASFDDGGGGAAGAAAAVPSAPPSPPPPAAAAAAPPPPPPPHSPPVEVLPPPSPWAVASNGHGNGHSPAVAFPAVALDSSRVRPVSAAAAPGGYYAAAAPAAAAAAAATAAAGFPDLGPGGPARELTAEERMRLTRLTDDELIALVNSDPDLDKVLSRLLGDK